MAMALSPVVFSPPPLLSRQYCWTERPSLRCCCPPGESSSSYSSPFSPAVRRSRRTSSSSSSSSRNNLQIQEEATRSSTRALVEKQSSSSSSSNSRRQFLVLLLSSVGSSSLPFAQFFPVDNDDGPAAAAAEDVDVDVDVDIGPGSVGIADELPDKTALEGAIIGDLFGFDGLGKTPEEYVLGKVVALAQAGDGAVLFLGVDGFETPLQLVVGPAEAMAVLTAVQERKSRRPVTHEAWGLSLAAVGWKVDRVVITGNEKEIFYSSVVLSNLSQLLLNPSGVKKSVDMRPSDGIALALRCRAPLFVRRKVAEDVLGPKADLAGKVQVDPLKQPGLQANSDAFLYFVENPVSSSGERKPDSTIFSSWMRRLQSF